MISQVADLMSDLESSLLVSCSFSSTVRPLIPREASLSTSIDSFSQSVCCFWLSLMMLSGSSQDVLTSLGSLEVSTVCCSSTLSQWAQSLGTPKSFPVFGSFWIEMCFYTLISFELPIKGLIQIIMSIFQRSLSDLKTIKLMCRRLGESGQAQVDRILSVFQRMPKVINFSNFYQQYLFKNTMGVFPNWSHESITFQIVDSELATDWPELYICMKPFLVFYVIDMSVMTPDEIQKTRKKDEKLIRYLIFNCNPDFLQNLENESLFILIPELSDDKLVYYLEDQLQMYICQVVEHFAYEILRLKNDQSALVLFNMREEKISEASKLKKRRLGRQIKIMGDFALMIGDLPDALDYYKQALEHLNKISDNLWSAVIHQNLAAVKKTNEEIEEHFREALILFKKTKFTYLEIECFFKLMHHRKDSQDRLGLDKTVDLFLKTFDPEAPLEKCKLYVFISELFGQLGMMRKQAFFIKVASNQVNSINKQVSYELMKKAALHYRMGSFLSDEKSDIFWPSLQRTLAQEIQYYFPDVTHQTEIQVLQLFKSDFSNQKLQQLFNELSTAARSKPLMRAPLTQIPELVGIKCVPCQGLFRLLQQKQETGDGIFIVNPWARKEKQALVYPKFQEICFEVTLNNQYSFGLKIESIRIEYRGVDCLSYPVSLVLRPELNVLNLFLKPEGEGRLEVMGVYVQFLDFVFVNEIEPIEIEIIEPLPNVRAQIYREGCQVNEVDAVYFDPSEIFTYQIQIQNFEEERIESVSFELCVEAEDPPIYEHSTEVQNYRVEGYQTTSLLLTTLKPSQADHSTVVIPAIPHSMAAVRKISLSLFFAFDNSKYQREIKINRLVVQRPRTIINQCLFITKYSCNNSDIKEIFDLQDSCYLSLQIQKSDPLINLELKSPIILDGSFKALLNENTQSYSKVLKLSKLPRAKLLDPDLKILWKNPFNGTLGLLKPFDQLSQEYLYKHFCNDLIEMTCKESSKSIHYTLRIHRDLTNAKEVFVAISLSNEDVSCSKSVVSSAKQTQQSVIVDGYVNYRLELTSEEFTVRTDQLAVMCHGPLPNLKVIVLDKENKRQFIKRALIN